MGLEDAKGDKVPEKPRPLSATPIWHLPVCFVGERWRVRSREGQHRRRLCRDCKAHFYHSGILLWAVEGTVS
jgi:hypothetical protein